MLQRVMPELMSMKRVVVLNDEAHHCYRHKPGGDEEEALETGEKEEARKPPKPHTYGSPASRRWRIRSASRASLTFRPPRSSFKSST
jgi:hypothetical protein